MNIRDFLSENSTLMANNYVERLKEKDPRELEQLTKLFNNLTEVAIHIMRESPEFRMQFAQIHREFLRYPECKDVIEEGINAASNYQLEFQSKINRH